MNVTLLQGEVSDEWLSLVLKAPRGTVFIINSSGGSASVARAVAQHIGMLEATTVAMGTVDSAAIPIFAAGDHRYSYPGCSFLWHAPYLDVSDGITATSRQCLAWKVSMSRWLTWASGLLASKSPDRGFNFWFDTADAEGHEFTVDDLLHFGLIHEVITNFDDCPFQPPEPARNVEHGEEGGDEDDD
jgi:ATP-dependent protease ClpP protease subunit